MSAASTILLAVAVLGIEALLAAMVRRAALRGKASPRLAMRLTLVCGALALPLWVGSALFGVDWDRHAGLMWTWVSIASVLLGLYAAQCKRSIPSRELVAAVGGVLGVAAVVVFSYSGSEGIAAPGVRAFLAAPVAVVLFAFFGSSLGYLLWGSAAGEADWSLGYEAMVGRRFLLSKSSPALSAVTGISVVGVALGVWLVLVALGVLSGFEGDLRAKIIGANAHVVVQQPGGTPFSLQPSGLERIAEVGGVSAAAPFVQGEVAIASSSNHTVALLFGIDPRATPSVLPLLRHHSESSLANEEGGVHGGVRGTKDGEAGDGGAAGSSWSDFAKLLSSGVGGDDPEDGIIAGSLAPLRAEMMPTPRSPAGMPEAGANAPAGGGMPAGDAAGGDDFLPPAPLAKIVVGVEMAKNLNVSVGDRVRVISPTLEILTPVGIAPKSLGFEVGAIFSSKMYEYDARFAYISLPAARRFYELDAGVVSGIQIAVDDPEAADRIGPNAAGVLGGGVEALDWKQRNQTLFAALKLERVVAFVVLVFIIFVAAFAIVNTLAMSVIEKRKEIAILKTMGARDVGIMKLFLVQGMVVGTSGTVIGAVAAVFTALAVQRIGLWIPADVYYIDSLPVRLDGADVLLVVAAALLVVWDFSVFPALSGSRLGPVEGLRDG